MSLATIVIAVVLLDVLAVLLVMARRAQTRALRRRAAIEAESTAWLRELAGSPLKRAEPLT
jgi:hypothetical protein